MQLVRYSSSAVNFNTLKITDTWERFVIRSSAEYLGPMELKITKRN
jgi:hypothetical protein